MTEANKKADNEYSYDSKEPDVLNDTVVMNLVEKDEGRRPMTKRTSWLLTKAKENDDDGNNDDESGQ